MSDETCNCGWHTEDRGGVYTEAVLEPNETCPQHGALIHIANHRPPLTVEISVDTSRFAADVEAERAAAELLATQARTRASEATSARIAELTALGTNHGLIPSVAEQIAHQAARIERETGIDGYQYVLALARVKLTPTDARLFHTPRHRGLGFWDLLTYAWERIMGR